MAQVHNVGPALGDIRPARRGLAPAKVQPSPNGKRKRAAPAGGLEPETLMAVLREVRKGNYTVRLPVQKGSAGKLAAELNFLIQSYQQNAEELARRAENAARVAQVLEAVAAGDLSQTMGLENEGRPLQEPFLGTARTVNSMARQLKQSQSLFVEAQEASRSKSAFLSMAAHELRTPLSVIIGYLSMLQDGTLKGEAARRPIEMLVGKAQELNGIINDLLMAARVERGTVPTQLVRLDLRDAVQEALGRAEPRVDLLKAALSYSAPASSVFVNVDRDQVGRILDNLINNALTYTKGRPEIFVAVTAGPSPQVGVEDHGVGIPSDMRELVFERFYRIDHPELGPQPGTGLGLFIGRELAQRLGGSLVLDWTEVGKGSRFVLRLPAAPGAEEEIRRVPAREPEARRRPRLSATPLEESRASR